MGPFFGPRHREGAPLTLCAEYALSRTRAAPHIFSRAADVAQARIAQYAVPYTTSGVRPKARFHEPPPNL